MNGGRQRAPGAGSPALPACSPLKMCSWVLSCCLALQVRGAAARIWAMGEGWDPCRWQDKDPATPRSLGGSGPDVLGGKRTAGRAVRPHGAVARGVTAARPLPHAAPRRAGLPALHLPPAPAACPARGAAPRPGRRRAAGTQPLRLRRLRAAADLPGEPVRKRGDGGAALTRRVMPGQGTEMWGARLGMCRGTFGTASSRSRPSLRQHPEFGETPKPLFPPCCPLP